MATAGKADSGAAHVVGYSRLGSLGRIAQRESARFTRGRSLVRSQVRPLNLAVRTCRVAQRETRGDLRASAQPKYDRRRPAPPEHFCWLIQERMARE